MVQIITSCLKTASFKIKNLEICRLGGASDGHDGKMAPSAQLVICEQKGFPLSATIENRNNAQGSINILIKQHFD